MQITKSLALATLFWLPLSVAAQPGEDGPRGKHRGPPIEAIEACEELAEDDPCSFVKGDEGEEEFGTCLPGPRPELPLACRPEHHEGRPPPPPPADEE